jgi:hypothetical protein
LTVHRRLPAYVHLVLFVVLLANAVGLAVAFATDGVDDGPWWLGVPVLAVGALVTGSLGLTALRRRRADEPVREPVG